MQQTEDATNPRTSRSRQINDVSSLPHDVIKVCGSYKHDKLYDITPMSTFPACTKKLFVGIYLQVCLLLVLVFR